MKPRSELTDAEETALCMNAEVDELLGELSYVPPLEIARGLIDNPADLEEGHARLLASIIRDRVRGSGVMKTRLDPPPIKKAKPATPVMAPARATPVKPSAKPMAPTAPDLFSC